MGNKLLVRAYNVGLGDCIYVRIPDPGGSFNMLIDCGSWSDIEWLSKAIKHLAADLPLVDGGNKKRLDLLVVTHRHHDHISGFGRDLFKNIQIENLWVSVAMDKNHPQAKGMRKFNEEVQRNLDSVPMSQLDPVMAEEVKRNKMADADEVKNLLTGLGVEPTFVYADMKQPKLPLKEAKIHILAPEMDIDGYYLGKTPTKAKAKTKDFALRAPSEMTKFSQSVIGLTSLKPGKIPGDLKISGRDFRQLQKRMMVNALTFAHFDNSFRNNTSVVLLIEWCGRRLLFPGDAEWHGEYRDGKHNGSWNVMWHNNRLREKIDFLKVGHHGSRNATPWKKASKRKATSKRHEVNVIFDTILPPPKGQKKPTAKAIVSTERGRYKTIPGVELVKALGERIADSVVYKNKLTQEQLSSLKRYKIEKQTIKHPQPLRTDFEHLRTGKNSIEVEIDQAKGWKSDQ